MLAIKGETVIDVRLETVRNMRGDAVTDVRGHYYRYKSGYSRERGNCHRRERTTNNGVMVL